MTRIVFVVLVGPLLWGQSSTTGHLQGLVVDATGSAVAGASLTLRSQSSGATRTLQSQEDGRFSITSLPIGSYSLRVQRESAAGLHASRDSFYLTATSRRQDRSGVIRIDLQHLPRWCPLCREKTIIGHGRRRRQAHDEHHDWIWVRRGLCRPCGKTFTILPSWSSPYGHYSFHCRQKAWESMCQHGGSWEQSAPHTKDPARMPDPPTLRRWACRRLVSLWQGGKARWIWELAVQKFLQAPTILAWDWSAARQLSRRLDLASISVRLTAVSYLNPDRYRPSSSEPIKAALSSGVKQLSQRFITQRVA